MRRDLAKEMNSYACCLALIAIPIVIIVVILIMIIITLNHFLRPYCDC